MRVRLAILVAKIFRVLTRLRGGGSAFPGWVLLRLVPDILERTIGKIPGGVVFVSGSNGKSTTTTMLASLARAHGLRVFSNPAGSNLPQGLASAVAATAKLSGTIRADIAILEVDEAYGPIIAKLLRPDWVVLTNLQIDQLNRFGEPERVWQMLRELCQSARAGLVVNAADPNLAQLGATLERAGAKVCAVDATEEATLTQAHGLVAAEIHFDEDRTLSAQLSAILTSTSGRTAEIALDDGRGLTVSLPAPGLHYAIDAAIAICALSVLLDTPVDPERVVESFENLPPVYGRGETIRYRGREIALTMMKNLPSLQVNLAAMEGPLERVWIAVDEGTPDPSWIWDVDLHPIDHVDVLSGTKAWQWALLLEHRGIPYGEVIEDTKEALAAVCALPAATAQPVSAIVNYEQMMLIRRLAGYKELEGSS